MSLRPIYGRAGSGKSYFCLNEIKEKLKNESNTPLILLVPEQYTLQTERNLIRMVGTAGIMRAEVLSFQRLAYRVFNEVGGVTRQHINSAGKCIILYRVMDRIKEQLKFFTRAVKQQGFVNTLCSTISEMKRYNVTPQLLANIKNGLHDDLLQDKLQDLHMIFDEFEKTLHQKYMDGDDSLTILADKLDRSSRLAGAEIWIDEFSGFTPQEYRIIEKLLNKAKRVNISLCTDCLVTEIEENECEIFSPTRNTAKKLLKLAQDCGVNTDSPVRCEHQAFSRFDESKELAHLEQYYAAFPYRTYRGKTKDIRIFSAANIYSEVEDTARDIIRLCRDKGMRYRDIAVVTRNLPGYEKLVQSIFGEYGIPCFIDRKKDISNHPFVLLVLSVLEIFIRNWSYESVFRYLKTDLTDIDKEDVDMIENYVLANGIKGSAWTKGEVWTFRLGSGFEQNQATEYEIGTLNKVNEIRQKITAPLANFRSKTKGRRNAREFCAALFEFLCDIGVPERIEVRIEDLKKEGQASPANEYGQIWNICMHVFDQIAESMGEDQVGVEKFRELLALAFGEYKIGLIPPTLDQVLVGSIERSKSHDIKALYILGINDGVFPAPAADEGILTDKDRQNLRKQGVELAQDTRIQAFEEQYLIYTALTTARTHLTLSYPIADHEGKTMRPSAIISRIKKLFPEIRENSNIVKYQKNGKGMEEISAPVPTFNQLVAAIRKKAEGAEMEPVWQEVYQWYMQQEPWKDKCAAVASAIHYSNQVQYVNSGKIRKLYGTPVYSSISRMERFASCPFAYYMQYGLKAKERKVFQLSAPDVGTFIHSVLDEFSNMLENENIGWRNLEPDWCTQKISEIVDDLIQKMSGSIFNSTKRYRYLTIRLKRVLTRAVWVIAQHIKKSGFDPLGYEMTFQDQGHFPPITLMLGSGEEIKLVGRIDRIDTMQSEQGSYLRIIDYKSGAKAFKLADAYYGLQIQLITYLDAIWENGHQKLQQPVLPGGILYFRIDDPIIKSRSDIQEEEIERAIMKQLKMKGLLLADVKMIKEMDRDIDGDSLIVPARVNKGDVLGKTSSAATLQQFEKLRGHVKNLLMQMGEELLKGNVSIQPYKKNKVSSCTYCNYASICQFDPVMRDNKYRVLQDIKDEEVWKLMGD
ncbi:helicase-exonuclease AddAB subunit AddB [Petroclostridium sp. X23]|uniref:helicase-exonuclease AddAB subunit AddB n=1 Tax=Petroclostridium sp. X23 TaxID=3045146 RepID=UPI0024ACCAED|nr:helicase-exonuclease AddAB subunit AddB [Petroclostridium sp. X23]WHH57447.1 helicase-exonuclease AddAB subunit AddB [Petroclostridium sp. X23]